VASNTPVIVPPALSLGAAEAHVWLDDLSADAHWNVDSLLSDTETVRAVQMRATERRLAFVRGRAALRYLAARYLDLPPASITTVETSKGKPLLVLPPGAGHLHANISHADTMVAVAFSKAAEIGVDVESSAKRVDRRAIARRFFSATEAAALSSRDATAFFDAWVCKEAVVKAAGVGIGGLSDVELSLDRGAPRLMRLGASLGAIDAWTLSMIDAGAGWSAAIAVHAPGVSVVVRRCAEVGDDQRGGRGR
jgi:4'-phosphopantetheinyl transferase